MVLADRASMLLRAFGFAGYLLLATAAHADLDVGTGGSVSLGSAAMDLGCTDINIATLGVLRLNSATVTGVRNVTIESQGVLDFGTGSITVAGAFTNNSGRITHLGPGSITLVTNLACAPNGPSISGVSLATGVPALSAPGLSVLGLLLAGFGIFMTWRRTEPIHERE